LRVGIVVVSAKQKGIECFPRKSQGFDLNDRVVGHGDDFIKKKRLRDARCVGAVRAQQGPVAQLGQVDELWDTIALAEYPSPAAMKEMVESADDREIAKHRDAGLNTASSQNNPTARYRPMIDLNCQSGRGRDHVE